MSSKIYFNTKGGVNVRRRAINVATRAYHRIAPSHARKTARNLLLTPERFSVKAQAPEGLQKKAIETSEGKIMTYSLGNGPTWLLGHGWSGSASQFYTLMERIAASGFT
ncbi:MAG: alpha/beta hydrolase, partial [Photobacterium halotolerans]